MSMSATNRTYGDELSRRLFSAWSWEPLRLVFDPELRDAFDGNFSVVGELPRIDGKMFRLTMSMDKDTNVTTIHIELV